MRDPGCRTAGENQGHRWAFDSRVGSRTVLAKRNSMRQYAKQRYNQCNKREPAAVQASSVR